MSPELLVVSIATGIVVSFLFSEVYGLAAGGVVVPGYVALYLHDPLAITLTLAIALASYAVVRVAGTFVIVYGRRRTALMILIAFAVGAWITRFEPIHDALFTDQTEVRVIGYIIPGLIAIWFDRQGIAPTVAALTIASVTVRLVLLLLFGPLVFAEMTS